MRELQCIVNTQHEQGTYIKCLGTNRFLLPEDSSSDWLDDDERLDELEDEFELEDDEESESELLSLSLSLSESDEDESLLLSLLLSLLSLSLSELEDEYCFFFFCLFSFLLSFCSSNSFDFWLISPIKVGEQAIQCYIQAIRLTCNRTEVF